MIRLSVVLPIYNEEEALPATLHTLSRALEEKIPGEWEIVAVNDGSSDGSLLILQRCASEIPSLKVVSYEKNRGKGGALKEGMCRAEGRFVLFTDCDLAYGVEEIFVFLSAFETEGTQLIVGSRSLSDDGYTGYSSPAADDVQGLFPCGENRCRHSLFRTPSAESRGSSKAVPSNYFPGTGNRWFCL